MYCPGRPALYDWDITDTGNGIEFGRPRHRQRYTSAPIAGHPRKSHLPSTGPRPVNRSRGRQSPRTAYTAVGHRRREAPGPRNRGNRKSTRPRSGKSRAGDMPAGIVDGSPWGRFHLQRPIPIGVGMAYCSDRKVYVFQDWRLFLLFLKYRRQKSVNARLIEAGLFVVSGTQTERGRWGRCPDTRRRRQSAERA